MNILFVFFGPSGGVETLNRQRSIALKQKNITSHFLYYDNQKEIVNNHHGPLFITNKDEDIKKILADGNYAAIVITSDYLSLPRFRKLGYQGVIILEIQGYGHKAGARAEMRHAVPYITQNGNALLNPKTPHIVRIFEEFYPDFPKYEFNNCLDASQFSYQSHDVPSYPILAWIGRFEKNKNWREFLKIGHRLITTHNPNIQLYMFHDPALAEMGERYAYQQLMNTLNLHNHVKVFTNVSNSEMAKYFSMIGDSGGFYCSTSKVEGAPYSVIEAMSCRCPVLTTDSDGVRSSVFHNKTGKYYQLGNIDDAAKKAIDYMTNTPLRERIRSNARIHVEKEFSHEQYAINFANMLRSLGVAIEES